MIVISSMCFVLLERLRQIEAELEKCTDEAKRESLLKEREIKRELQRGLLDAAYEVPRRRRVGQR